MSEPIIFIMPNEASTEHTRRILQSEGIQIPVYESFMETALNFARHMIEEGTKVIISRGSTAHLLRSNLNIPIIEVRYSFYEFTVAMQKGIRQSRRIGVVGYNESFHQPELADFFHPEQFEIRVIEPSQTEETLRELKNLGIELVLTGQKIGETAVRMGLLSVLVQVSTANVLNAITDARYLLNVENEKQRQFDSIAALYDQTQESILSIDATGQIQSINQAGRKLLKLDDRYIGHSIYNSLPKNLVDLLLGGTPLYNEVIKIDHESVLLSGTSTRLENDIIGAVITFQPADDIQKKEHELRRNSRMKGRIAKNNFENIIGRSDAIHAAKTQAALFAATDSNVLIYGPTGTGKELFAQSIHNASARRNNPFVAINCAALPESVLESELFGYVKGAFTGARTEGKIGIFEQAHTGTIFLDEISEISPSVQARLLRVLQEREITRIGDDRIIPIDVRIIASTNRNLMQEIHDKQFREDLYYRLSVLNMIIPPLSERAGDVPLLFDYFLDFFCRNIRKNISAEKEAVQILEALSWPGNIRQLRNTVECAVALCQGDTITTELMHQVVKISRQQAIFAKEKEPSLAPASAAPKARSTSSEEEKARILAVLEECGGNKTIAARKLGIGYATLWRRMKAYGLM